MGIYYGLFPCVLSVVEYFVSQTTLKKFIGNNITIVHAAATYVIIAAIIVLFLPWYVLQKFLEISLKLHHGKNYGGMLNGPDRTTDIDTPKPLIVFCYILEHDGTIRELYEDVKEACTNLYNSDLKFSSVIKRTLGYQYYIGNQIKIDDVIYIQDWRKDFVSKDDLSEYLDDKYLNSPFNDEQLLEIIMFNKPMQDPQDNGSCYPVLIRTNHAMADAIHLSVFHHKYLMNKTKDEQFTHAVKSKNSNVDFKRLDNMGKYFTKPVPHYSLKAKNTKKVSCLYMEDTPVYWERIKQIKKRANVTFTDVFVTAAACSLRDHFTQNSLNIDKILYGATCRPVTEDTKKVLSGTRLTNETTFMINMLDISQQNIPISTLLREYAKRLNDSKNSTDSQVAYLMQTLGAYIPHPIFKAVHNFLMKPVLFGLTNIPSIASGYINNHHIRDAFIYVNSFNNTRFMFQIFTYSGRLQVNLTVEENTVNSREELDNILAKTFANIDQLYQEVIR